MKRRLAALTILVAAIGLLAYPASALRAMIEVRTALVAADTATLERRIDFPSVRASLRGASGETRQFLEEVSAQAGTEAAPRGLWQRIKAAALPYVTDPLIDRYVTAERAPRLWSMRQTWRDSIRPRLGLNTPATPLEGTWLADTGIDRTLELVRRLERIAIAAPHRLELAIRDRHAPTRLWHATLELRRLTWVLTEVRVTRTAASGATTAPPAAMPPA
ncbi:MAG: DUF2939 domain-containing protein [Hyphomicrobiaceae bacterium]